MSKEVTEYTPIKLIVRYRDEASIGLIYQPLDQSQPIMIYKIILKNIYSIENPTRNGIKERIFADHPFLFRSKKMEENIEQALKQIFQEREDRIQMQQKNDELNAHENKEGTAATMPTTKKK
ncbi:unnamed protein product [Paramecium octaurelia]|uniref:Uncharacterized protein n=1 Tax=Paramecium octaurelia TaxID=43137 RepID=A0A8S1W8D9_PAROT|nr:unnamed protein product [Paramecium octaurelia]